MSTPDKFQLIFEKWKAALRDRKRNAEYVASNFDDLFDELSNAGATFDEAYEILPAAIKAHQPRPDLIRQVWKLNKVKSKGFDLSEKEFADKWCGDISDQATNSFYNSFPMPVAPGSEFLTGKIDTKEYKLLRQRAAQFNPIDWTKIPEINDELMTDEEEIWKWLKERMKNE
jgi:hypothetical protein